MNRKPSRLDLKVSGHSAICSFPFRIYGNPNLEGVKIERADVRVRIHAPATLRKKGTPLSPDYPPGEWPDFRWSPWLGRRQQALPPSLLTPSHGLGEAYYDGLRVDFWGDDAERELRAFVERFLGWLRHLAGQPWIGRFEPQTDARVKYSFAIDAAGRANEAPMALLTIRIPGGWARPVTNEMMEDAGDRAIDTSPPLYWATFYDACMARAVHDTPGCILLLAIALEIARDTCFPSFAATQKKRVGGEVLSKPFDGSDLLRHLSTALQSAHPEGHNLERDLPAIWIWTKALYSARHHVAHGGPTAGVVDGSVRHLVDDDISEALRATYQTIRWIEQL